MDPDGDVYQLPRLEPWDQSQLKFGLRLAMEYTKHLASAA
jgi:hypothetical protein